MSEKKQPDAREARRAKALRNNLRRRKQAARKPAPDTPPKPAGDATGQ